MIKLLIVDCEDITHQVVARLLQDNLQDIEQAGSAHTGAEALQKLEQLKPDVMLIDIDLPDMDGFRVIEHARLGNDIQVIILSMVDENAAIRSAVSLGVVDYLLKPVSAGEIALALCKARDAFRKEVRQQRNRDILNRWVRSVHPYLKLGLGCGIVYDLLSDDTVSELGLLWGITERPIRVLFVSPDHDYGSPRDVNSVFTWDMMYDPSRLDRFFWEHLLDVLEQVGCQPLFPWGGLGIAVIATNQSFETIAPGTQTIAHELQRRLRRGSLTVTVGVGNCARGPSQVKVSFQQALMAAQYRLLLGGDRVILYHEIQSSIAQVPASLGITRIEQLTLRDVERIEHWIEEVISTMTCDPRGPDAVRTFSLQILFWLTERAAQEGTFLGDALQVTNKFIPSLLAARKPETVLSLLKTAAVELGKTVDHTGNQVIKHALKLLESSRFSFNLKEVAKALHVSPGHLSRLFKHELGESFKIYTNKMRMEVAARCLRTEKVSVHEVARMVGFDDANHFSRAFKQTFGVSPSIYREQQNI